MKKLLTLALALTLFIAGNSFALPMLFDIWELDNGNKTKIGSVSAIKGDTDAVTYYNYYSASGHPDLPDPEPQTSQMWLYYDNNNNLSFNLIHGADAQGPNYWNHVRWDVVFNDMDTDVLLQDDTPEQQGEAGIDYQGNGYYWMDFAYKKNTDGGVISMDPDDCCDWSVWFRPYKSGDVTNIRMASGDGSYLDLWEGDAYPNWYGDDGDYISKKWDGPAYKITPNCDPVPEPGTLMLLGSGLLMGAGYIRRKRNNKE